MQIKDINSHVSLIDENLLTKLKLIVHLLVGGCLIPKGLQWPKHSQH